MRRILSLCVVALFSVHAFEQSPQPSPDVAPFISVNAPTFALVHVRVIDGTGAPAKEDQTVVVSNGKITALGPTASTQAPAGAQTIDKTGYTVIPGLVGMHNHLYYTNSASYQRDASGKIGEPGLAIIEVPFTGPRLYLASGVTTMRTTGSIEPYTDIKVKQRVDAGLMPGPKIDASAPYLEGKPTFFAQMHELTGTEDARRLVDYWADEGMTSYKAYMNISRDELSAAIQEAHKRGFKLTGHLCSVTWHEAAALGIDDLEHGPIFTATDFVADKKPDACPKEGGEKSWASLDVNSPQVQGLIRDLISHHVAVTSTLPVFDAYVAGRPPMQQRVLDAMSDEARMSYLTSRARLDQKRGIPESDLKKEMAFEYAFAKAGGLLLAGPDPTGNGGTLPGFGDQREVELLVEAGFTPVEAIQVSTQNGAKYLGRDKDVGTITVGKAADLVLIKGDPSKSINDVENVETVFKDGTGYDSKKLIESVKGQVGIR
jgi:hypothetical protein